MATIYEKGKPTPQTAGKVGDIYIDTNTGLHYKCDLAYKDEPNEALTFDWRQIPVDDALLGYLAQAESPMHMSPWISLDVYTLDPDGELMGKGWTFNDIFGEVRVIHYISSSNPKFSPSNGIYHYGHTVQLANPDNREHLDYWYGPTNLQWALFPKSYCLEAFNFYVDLRSYKSTESKYHTGTRVFRDSGQSAIVNPSTILFSDITKLRYFVILFTQSGTVRGILMPKNLPSGEKINSSWMKCSQDASEVIINKIHGNNFKDSTIYLKEKH